jgi:hypothetical protein
MKKQTCEKCGRIRSVKYLERAVYVGPMYDGSIGIQKYAAAYRCYAKASCKNAVEHRKE